jgi:uncharacterized protein with PIN domain
MAVHRFAVDRMLGRLATWLRLIGQDATYGSHLSGLALLRHARAEGRTILTRDHRLLRHLSGMPHLFIESDHFRDQLRQVVATLGVDPFVHTFTRCARCNAPVVPIPREAVGRRVPPYVFATQQHFVLCPECGRVYWPATHQEHARDELRGLGFRASRKD